MKGRSFERSQNAFNLTKSQSRKLFKDKSTRQPMTEAIAKVMDDLEFLKEKVQEMDKELHQLREEFADTHMTEEERKLFAEALEEERKGQTVSLAEMRPLI